MKATRVVLAVVAMLLFGALSMVSAQSNESTKKTIVTTSHPLQVPGTVLAPGKYVFKVVNVTGSNNVVRVTNEDGTQSLALFMAIADYRLKPKCRTVGAAASPPCRMIGGANTSK